MVVPVCRVALPFLSPACLQFQGTAQLLDGGDPGARAAFGSSWFLRTILTTEDKIVAGGGQLVFICVRPDPVIFTYGFGISMLTLRRQAGQGAARVSIPAPRLET